MPEIIFFYPSIGEGVRGGGSCPKLYSFIPVYRGRCTPWGGGGESCPKVYILLSKHRGRGTPTSYTVQIISTSKKKKSCPISNQILLELPVFCPKFLPELVGEGTVPPVPRLIHLYKLYRSRMTNSYPHTRP